MYNPFQTQSFNYRNITYKAASYTALVTDELIKMNGSSLTLTLFPINSLKGLIGSKKELCIQNLAATDLTITPGTDTETGVANTIFGKSTWALKYNETLVIYSGGDGTDWKMASPSPTPTLGRQPFHVTKKTNGTTAVHIFSSDGAPANLYIDEVLVNALDTIASTITITGGASTVVAVAKGTTLSAITPATTIASPVVASGSTLSMVGDGTGDARVTIIGTMQTF